MIYRPRTEPASIIYDAIIAKAEERKDKDPDDWIPAEKINVWEVARDYAQQHGLRWPTLAEVDRAESTACGHVDYAAKWAYGVADLLRATGGVEAVCGPCQRLLN